MMRVRRSAVIYSPEFVELVRKAYPNDECIERLLNDNEYVLGRYLDDGCSGGRVSFSADGILILIANSSPSEVIEKLRTANSSPSEVIEKLRTAAEQEKVRAQAYKMWGDQWFYEE